MDYIKKTADGRHGVIKGLLTVCLLCGTLVSAFAETYTFGYVGIESIFPMFFADDSLTNTATFDENSKKWTLELTVIPNNSSTENKVTVLKSSTYSTLMLRYSRGLTTSIKLSTNAFAGQFVKSVTINAGFCYSDATDADMQIISLIADGNEYFTHSDKIIRNGVFHGEDNNIVKCDISRNIQKEFSISFSNSIGAEFGSNQFGIKSIEIEYEYDEVPQISRKEVIAVGHQLVFDVSVENAEIFYTVDGSENWLPYNQETGIQFDKAGVYTLKYYAVNGNSKSEIVTEEIEVVRPSGLYAAIAANGEYDVHGVICGRGTGYVLIGSNVDAPVTEQLALDSSAYPDLQEAALGSMVKVTGRPTDRFGQGVKALGSLTAVTISETPLEPTSINCARIGGGYSEDRYDLQGRRINSGKSYRRITFSTSGEKRYDIR